MIGPLTTVYYDSGFLIGLKGFVAAIVAGLVSYPGAAAAAIADRHPGIALLLLGERLQGGDRLHGDHPGAVVALARPGEGRGGGVRMPRRIAAAAAFLVALAVPLAARRAALLGDLARLYRAFRDRGDRPRGAHRHRRHDLFRAGDVRGLRRLCDRDPHDALRPLALARACPIAILVTAVAATLIGAITLNLSGHYLPVGTMAWNISFYYVAGNLDFFRRYDGISGIPPLTIFGVSLLDGARLYYLILDRRRARHGRDAEPARFAASAGRSARSRRAPSRRKPSASIFSASASSSSSMRPCSPRSRAFSTRICSGP